MSCSLNCVVKQSIKLYGMECCAEMRIVLELCLTRTIYYCNKFNDSLLEKYKTVF